jgi:hypothetical protein
MERKTSDKSLSSQEKLAPTVREILQRLGVAAKPAEDRFIGSNLFSVYMLESVDFR